jgi:hypothetical protein
MGKKPVFGLAGCFLAAAALAGCQNTRSSSGSTSQSLVRDNTNSQSQQWNTRGTTNNNWGSGNSSMASRNTGMSSGTPVAQSFPTSTGATNWGNQGGMSQTATGSSTSPTSSTWPGSTGTPTTAGSVTPTGGWGTQTSSSSMGAGNSIVPPGPPTRTAATGFASDTTTSTRMTDTSSMPESLNVGSQAPVSRTSPAMPTSVNPTGTYSDSTPRTNSPMTGSTAGSGIVPAGSGELGASAAPPMPAPVQRDTVPPAQPEQYVPVGGGR